MTSELTDSGIKVELSQYPDKTLFIYFDEAGDINFSNTKENVVLTSLIIDRSDVEKFVLDIFHLKQSVYLIAQKVSSQIRKDFKNYRFHASEDPQLIRDMFFDVISNHKENVNARAIIIFKNNIYDYLRTEEWLYSYIYYYQLKGIIKFSGWIGDKTNIQLILDGRYTNAKQKWIRSGISQAIRETGIKINYNVHFAPSFHHPFLQTTDYIAWAIRRKYQFKDLRSYNIIKDILDIEKKVF